MKTPCCSCEPNPNSSDIQPTASPLHQLGYRVPTKNTNAIAVTNTIIVNNAFHLLAGLSSVFLSSYLKLGIDGSELHNHINTQLLDLYTEDLSFMETVNMYCRSAGQRSRYSDWLRAGRPRGLEVEFRYGKDFSLLHSVQTGSGAHPASYPMGNEGSFPWSKAAEVWSWRLTSA
jgi:hypothetical protein